GINLVHALNANNGLEFSQSWQVVFNIVVKRFQFHVQGSFQNFSLMLFMFFVFFLFVMTMFLLILVMVVVFKFFSVVVNVTQIDVYSGVVQIDGRFRTEYMVGNILTRQQRRSKGRLFANLFRNAKFGTV